MPFKRNRHGLKAPLTKVRLYGLGALDTRMASGKRLLAWRRELLEAAGGEKEITPQRRLLLDVIIRTKFYIDHLDSWLLRRRSLVNAKKESAIPALEQRQAFGNDLARLLDQFGLDRAKPNAGAELPEDVAERILRRAKGNHVQSN